MGKIYTVTLNPALDYVMELQETLVKGITNRSQKERYYSGGKGLMVSTMLNNLGVPSTAFGYAGGFVGQELLTYIAQMPMIEDRFFEVKGTTRLNLKIKDGEETEINGAGPTVTVTDREKLEAELRKLQSDDLVILAGSIVPGFPSNWYVTIAEELDKLGIPFIVDIASVQLLDLLQFKPVMVKPNEKELSDILGGVYTSEAEIIAAAQELQAKGPEVVIVSRGGKGAILVTKDLVLNAPAIPGKMIDSVGAGDSMVAGFAYGYKNFNDLEKTFAFASSCGAATAFSPHIGSKELVEELFAKAEVVKL